MVADAQSSCPWLFSLGLADYGAAGFPVQADGFLHEFPRLLLGPRPPLFSATGWEAGIMLPKEETETTQEVISGPSSSSSLTCL